MIKNILVPVDGSSFAEQAFPHALTLAQATGARVHLVMVHEVRPPGERFAALGSELVEAQAREVEVEYLDTLEKRLTDRLRNEPRVGLLSGTTVTALSRYVSREDIDLIVMSTHGRSGFNRAWLGSVADGLARRSRVPILLVKPLEDGHEQMKVSTDVAEVSIDRVLAAVDGSDEGEAAARHAATLCAATGAQCTVVRVVLPPIHVTASRIPDTAQMVRENVESQMQEAERYLRNLPGRLKLPGSTRTEVITAFGAADAILRAAESDSADVVVIGTRGHGGAVRLILGSVADKVIRGSRVPVLVCPRPR